MIQETRVRELSDEPILKGNFVLYWMQASQRTHHNHALEYAIDFANELDQPLIVGFGLMDDYPEANERHYAFLLEGLRDVHLALKDRKIKFVVRHGQPHKVMVELGHNASVIVCDRGYTRHQKAWRDHVADHAGRRVIEVESDVVVPVDVVSEKQEFAARTIRPKIHKHLGGYLLPLIEKPVKHSSLQLAIQSDIDVSEPRAALAKLKLDRSVSPVTRFVGGQVEAQRRLKTFIASNLTGYAEGRNEPSAGHTSFLSSYLHFGNISPLDAALAAKASGAPQADVDSFIEELVVRRELSMNYVNFCAHYDSFEGLPDWAKKTLRTHAKDKRERIYSPAEFEASATNDPYWNASMTEMTRTGFMHNYMRMYWGKKVLQWTRTPEEAHAMLLGMNNKYFLCGRDPISYANVSWIFGLHDRPWGPERPIFGLVRYMNDKGLDRKFDMDAYLAFVASL